MRGIGLPFATTQSIAHRISGGKEKMMDHYDLLNGDGDRRNVYVARFLASLAVQKRTATNTFIADALGIARGTLYDRLRELEHCGLVTHDNGRPRRYSATPTLEVWWKVCGSPGNKSAFGANAGHQCCETCGHRTDYVVHFCGLCGSPCVGGRVAVTGALDDLARHLDGLRDAQRSILDVVHP